MLILASCDVSRSTHHLHGSWLFVLWWEDISSHGVGRAGVQF